MVLLNSFATPLMMSATNVALPAIAADLGLGAVALAWVPMASLMASAMFVLLFGSLADRVGRKRVFLLGTAAVIASSALAAVAVNTGMLIGARFLQGVSAAMLYATQIALVSSVFPAERRGRMVGLVVAAIYIGLAAGPLLGGYVNDTLGWRFVFLLQVPPALVVLLVGMLKVPQEWSAGSRPAFDLKGALLYGVGILLLCVAVTRLPAVDGGVLLVAGGLCIAGFIRHARRTPAPLWDVKLFFGNRLFTLSCAAALLMYSATYANVVLLSLYLQYLKALPATQAGLLMMIQPLTMALLSPLAGRLSDRADPRVLPSLGMAITALGLLLLASLDASSSLDRLVLALLLTGAGFSLFSSPNVNTIMGAVAPRYLGSAAGAVATTRLLGQLSSMVLVSLMLALLLGNAVIAPETYPQLERAIRYSFALAALLCVPGILFSLVRGGRQLQGGEPA
jgi:EmrB/QacA subfamily drug resistance transporter